MISQHCFLVSAPTFCYMYGGKVLGRISSKLYLKKNHVEVKSELSGLSVPLTWLYVSTRSSLCVNEPKEDAFLRLFSITILVIVF